MSTVHCQVVIPAASGMDRDAVINTWTFTAALAAVTLAGSVQPWLESFYNDVQASGFSVAHYLNETRDRSTDACSVRYYDITAHLNGSSAGPPVAVTPWTLASTGAVTPLPDEVAIALSFHGADDSIPEFGPGTRPKARHRGRVFIGPLIDTASAEAPTHEARPSDGVVATLLEAASALSGDAGDSWNVWSRANAAVYPVVGGWVDNAFDTIRGRGPDPTVKNFWNPPV